MSFLKTILILMLLYLIPLVYKSFAGEISNCKTCGNIINKESSNFNKLFKNNKDSNTSDKESNNDKIYANADDELVCNNWKTQAWQKEALRRNLDCKSLNMQDASISGLSDASICEKAVDDDGLWAHLSLKKQKFVAEAMRRKLRCGVQKKFLTKVNDTRLCRMATREINRQKIWVKDPDYVYYFWEARDRGLNCGANDSNKSILAKNLTRLQKERVSATKTEISDRLLCYRATNQTGDIISWSINKNMNKYVLAAKNRGLDCGVKEQNKIVIASKPNNNKTSILSKELDNEIQKRKALEQKLAFLEKEKQKRIEEERKRKVLEKKLAALQSEKKKPIKKAKQNEIGSGFYVSKFRHIVTNQHVVNKCKKITVGDSISKQIPAELIASDKRNDLAILQTVSMEMASADTKSFVQKLAIQIVPVLSGGLMRSDDVVGGEEIFVAGFPLGNMVSDQMKLTDGIVSATKGLDNDVSQFEISSVVRKGNSGGPIYDSKGNIVGVVVERFNVNRSDNVNFAIKGSTVKQFLSAHNVSTKWSNRQDDMSTQDIYKIASKQTVMVVCHR